MPSNARVATGTLIQRGNGATPEVFTTIAEIVSVKWPGFSRNEIDVTNHNTGMEATLHGVLRTGQITGKLNWVADDATHTLEAGGMLGDIWNNTKANYRIANPTPGEAIGTAGWPRLTAPMRLSTFEPSEATVDSGQQVDFALKITDLSAAVIEVEEET